VVRELEAPWSRDFDDPAREWRRLISEVFGTLLLVMVGVSAGGAVVDAVSGGQIGRGAAVTAPGPMVLAIILFMGAIGSARLNTVVSVEIRDARRLPVASRPRLPTLPGTTCAKTSKNRMSARPKARTARFAKPPISPALPVRVWQPRAGEPTRPGPKLTVTLAHLAGTSI
jgi:hypothetical protein